MLTLTAIFVGGGLGSVCRYLISLFVAERSSGAFPWGTLAVNVVGSFLIGLIVAAAARHFEDLPEALRLGAAVGFCGGFTTFSTFSMEAVRLLRDGQTATALLYVGASVVLSLAGFWLADLLIRGLR